MKVAALTGNLESLFWNHVNQDKLDYFPLISDWKLHREQTKIFLAIDNGEKISGLTLIYDDRIVQVRGNHEAVQLLLGNLPVEAGELMAPLDRKDAVFNK